MVTEVKRHQGSWPLTHRPRTYIGVGDRKDDTANYAVEDWSWLVQPPTQLFAILDLSPSAIYPIPPSQQK